MYSVTLVPFCYKASKHLIGTDEKPGGENGLHAQRRSNLELTHYVGCEKFALQTIFTPSTAFVL